MPVDSGKLRHRLEKGETKMKRTYAAYDYDKQEWITGDKAKQLLRKQTREHLDLLSGPRGQSYFNNIRTPEGPQTLLEAQNNAIEALEGYLA